MAAFAFTPESAWRAAAQDARAAPALAHLATLALVPAAVAALLAVADGGALAAAGLNPLAPGSPFADALHGASMPLAVPVTPLAERGTPATAAQVGALAYVGTWLMAAGCAVILDLLLPLYAVRRSLRRCFAVVAYSSTPLLISSVMLLHASLAPVVALAAMHACYVAYLGVPAMLGVPRSEAGACLAIAAIAALVLGQAAGYGAGALLTALAR